MDQNMSVTVSWKSETSDFARDKLDFLSEFLID